MKKNKLPICTLIAAIVMNLITSQDIIAQDRFNFNDATVISYSKLTNLPNFIKINADQKLNANGFNDWIKKSFNLDASITFKPYRTQRDETGMMHIRYKQYVNEYVIDGTMLIAHIKDGNIVSINGDFYQQINSNLSSSVSEQTALISALRKVNAKIYKWQNTNETNHMRMTKNDPTFSYVPKGELVVVHKSGADYSAASIRLAYKFNIYAEEPLSRAYIYVDAETGEVVSQEEIIHTADVIGTASTLYSGNVTMTSDNYATGQYRLRETGRGDGIQTYNLNNTSPPPFGQYTYTEFTNNSSAWDLPAPDQAAVDAHWGAEKTYDYFLQKHALNSIDGTGFALLSYVHYGTNYVNAFWDGDRMTYGDGNPAQGYTIMTALDVCGHEITHGLNSFTAGLNGGSNPYFSTEGGALNEAWSDILGTSVECFARPSQWDWLMGADLTASGNGLRNMANPKSRSQPDTYLGQYWDASTGEVHKNDGPAIFWYYLLCEGGTGTNDNNDVYNVTGITMAKAEKIAFLALTNYATPNTDYTNMRLCTIQAAEFLYGACSPEVTATANAWYAVGVGTQYSPTVVASFSSNITTSCSLPATISFINSSTNASNAAWDFGDNTTSTQLNPSHTYTNAGTYTVTLIASSGCGSNSITETSYININSPTAPTTTGASGCGPAALSLSATGGSLLNWYSTATGGASLSTGTTFTTPVISSSTTYYVESASAASTGTAGPADNTFGSGLNQSVTTVRYQIFDVLQACTLVSVKVYATGAGNRTINLYDNAGTVIQTWTKNIPNGASTVTLNAPLTPGTGFRLGGISMNLYLNTSNCTYPYSYSGYVDITGNSTNPANYYYFYNWVIEGTSCTSSRTPVTAQILICSGINTSSLQTGVSIFPNPSNGNITVGIGLAKDEHLQLNVMNTLGQTVISQEHELQSGDNKLSLDLSTYAKGIYYLQIKTATDVAIKRLDLN